MITESSSCPLLMFAAGKALLVAMIGCWGQRWTGHFEVVGMLLLELLIGSGALATKLNSQLPQLTVHGILFSTGMLFSNGMLFSIGIVTWL